MDPMSEHRLNPVPEEKPCCNLSKNAKNCVGILCVVVVVTIVAVVVGVLKWGQARKHKEWNGKGTTPHFPEIVLGRCYTYTQVKRPELSNKDCQEIAKVFQKAFLSKDPCLSVEQDYQPLMELTRQAIPCSKSLFWSKSNELAHQYTRIQQEMFTLEDSLLGYIADGLTWCGDAGSSEMNYQSCPHWRKDCLNNTVSVFWDTVSRQFAENACGVVQVVLNGSHSNTFDKNSTFGRVEVHNLQAEKVPTLQAWVMHDLEGAHRHTCSSSLINDLKVILSTRNISFTCEDNYRPIRLLQCVKNPEHSFCSSVK
ncbi:ADP-ribosyl cyclase/cyclic ADP-ribose hydrolase 1 [Pteronotus mesoamericanus]|uniref:ADP-ribosyl cyclase/cyclic ADP-ribose hydrolase 1 n=1 Tax=Pteronotus mesoamericanus TaxID=1884717 RepID=UPI0023ECD38B|nr:ADP-ribosyl cyclase/cyclic ADP-ribose hydrolase 1 [Pteronotus parnellii mesoamericanus]